MLRIAQTHVFVWIFAMGLLMPTAALAQPSPSSSSAFAQGLTDRRVWEAWFGGLNGPYKAGAEFWAGQRSLPHPGGCFATDGRDLGAWSEGCRAAQRFLGPTDARRRSEPEYRLGWNSFDPTQATVEPAPLDKSPPSLPQGSIQSAPAPLPMDPSASTEEKKRHEQELHSLRNDPVFANMLGSDAQDITALVPGHDTTNVVRNLKGQPVLLKGATGCLPFGTLADKPDSIEWRFMVDVERQIEQVGQLVDASLLLTTCGPAELGGNDLIVFSRSQIGNGTVGILGPLVELLRKRQFVPFGIYKFADFTAAETARAEAARLEAEQQKAERLAALKTFETRDPSVVSVIHIDTPAKVVCISSSPDPDGVRYFLKRTNSPFAGTVTPESAVREFPSSDAIFIALKRKECTAAVAPASILKEVVSGLTRDGFAVGIDKEVVSADQLATWKTSAAQERAAQQEQQARALAEAEEQRKLDQQRRKNDEAVRREELERTRKQVASKATAVMENFARRVREHIASVVEELKEIQQRANTGQVLSSEEQTDLEKKYARDRISFEPWGTQVGNLVKEGWEFDVPIAKLEDYGRAQWKQRTIEAITVRVEFPIVNRVIGERRVVCDDFTWINEEFQFARQLQAVSCDDYDRAFAEWSQANGFVSLWKFSQASAAGQKLEN